MPSDLRSLAEQSNAWPFEQAKAIVARLKKKPKDEVLFETGYGPSGLPHIGTFGEVARTTMVRHAFRVLTDDKIKTRLLAFSDDMDGLRKVPDNVPNRDMMAQHLGKPLTRVPDPFSNEYPSFGAANNARLRAFLDHFGFDYEFASSTDYYCSGRFDETLLKMLAAYDKVMEIILPTLGPERRATYSPFLPISKTTGIVLQVPMISRDVAKGTIDYVDPDTGEKVETDGHRRRGEMPVEGRLGHALGRARRRLRNGRQGSDRLGQAVGRDHPRARRHAAGRLQLRALPRRAGPEDFQVQGQWADHRRMAALRLAGIAVAVHVPRAEGGQAPALRRHPAQCRRVPAIHRRLRAGRTASSSSPIRSGTCIRASRRRSRCPSPSSCC